MHSSVAGCSVLRMLVRFPQLIMLLGLSILLIFRPLVLFIVEGGGADVSNYNCGFV